ncbi:MAG TPA: PQQ-dependent sugar dehydrogenase [Gammaproteobacteria bacterium]|nr:PQQ-dependent sugar dehydrogenase [Gammaproteobacteria bacterium]
MTRRIAVTALSLGILAPLLTVSVCAQQQPDLGISPVALGPGPYVFDTAEQHRIRVDVVVRGLPHPFSLAFLPDGDALISERGGHLRLVPHATGAGGQPMLDPEPIQGGPEPGAFRGAGLHEVAVSPDFATSRLVYFTYNRPGKTEPKTDPKAAPAARPAGAVALARARLEGKKLVDREELFSGEEKPGTSGSRLAFAPGGKLFMTTGAPFDDSAQKLDNVYGKVLRLNADGSVPKDNPFVGRPGARPEVYTLGHRDQLGLTVDPRTGAVLAAEHGPNGGDEVNLILPGRNYGWPEYSFGRTYEGPRISKVPLGPDTEQPLILWLPSIAPTGMTFYTGDRIPAWKGNLFIGSARRGEIPRTGGLERVVLNDKLEELRRERLLTDLHQRIRDVRQGPDGLLYVITDEDDGALLRISPAE